MKLKYFSLFFVFFFLTSCSIPTGIYIQNLTDKIVTLKIKLQRPYKGFFIGDEINFYNMKEITTVKNLRNKKNIEKLSFIKIDEKTFAINLPPNSTTEIEKTHNFNYNLDQIEFNNRQINLGELKVNSKIKKDNYIYQITE